jgi:hypothetical protein
MMRQIYEMGYEFPVSLKYLNVNLPSENTFANPYCRRAILDLV